MQAIQIVVFGRLEDHVGEILRHVRMAQVHRFARNGPLRADRHPHGVAGGVRAVLKVGMPAILGQRGPAPQAVHHKPGVHLEAAGVGAQQEVIQGVEAGRVGGVLGRRLQRFQEVHVAAAAHLHEDGVGPRPDRIFNQLLHFGGALEASMEGIHPEGAVPRLPRQGQRQQHRLLSQQAHGSHEQHGCGSHHGPACPYGCLLPLMVPWLLEPFQTPSNLSPVIVDWIA